MLCGLSVNTIIIIFTYSIESIICGVKMSTIYVSPETKRELIRISGELQKKYGTRVSLDEVIRFLIKCYRERHRKKYLFELFTKPVPELSFDECYEELIKERRSELERNTE